MPIRCFLLRLALAFCLVGTAAGQGVGGTNLTGTIADVKHVVILMQENRSFDHVFGSLAGVRGFGDHSVLIFPDGTPCFAQPGPEGGPAVLPFLTSSPCINDVTHSWTNTHHAWDGGWWDDWVVEKGAEAMVSYARSDLPFYYALADAYTVCDAYHCSVLGPTNPNRLMLWTGTIDPRGANGGPVLDNTEPTNGFTWTTYPERLQAAEVSWRVYQQADNDDDNALAWFAQYKQALPGDPLHDRGMAVAPDLVGAFAADVTNGALPRVSWIVAPSRLSEHPAHSIPAGEALTKSLLDVLAAKPEVYRSTVFLLTYDENDGFFDHVPSPTPPIGAADEFIGGVPIGLGPRVPAIVVSPWSRGGAVCSDVLDHTSILRFLETWTGVEEPNLSPWRRLVCGDLTSAFDFTRPDYTYPSLLPVTNTPCTTNATPEPPPVPSLPAQEPGAKRFLPLRTRVDAFGALDCPGSQFQVSLTNAGSASAHFALYVNSIQRRPPVQADIPPSSGTVASFGLDPATGLYDVSCYGPGGFLRRFAGSTNAGCEAFEAVALLGPSAGGLALGFRNQGSGPVTFTITNGYPTGGPWSVAVPAGGAVTMPFAAAASSGLYDLSVGVDVRPGYLRRFAGRLDPVPAPALAVSLSDGLVELSYPGWASSFTLQATTNLAGGSWETVSATPQPAGTNVIVDVPASASAQFYRLQMPLPAGAGRVGAARSAVPR